MLPIRTSLAYLVVSKLAQAKRERSQVQNGNKAAQSQEIKDKGIGMPHGYANLL
jgi:hypothetical protein